MCIVYAQIYVAYARAERCIRAGCTLRVTYARPFVAYAWIYVAYARACVAYAWPYIAYARPYIAYAPK